jgi:hypothetical protein
MMHAKIASIAQLGERQTEEIIHPSGGPVFDSLSRHIPFELLSSLVPSTPFLINPTATILPHSYLTGMPAPFAAYSYYTGTMHSSCGQHGQAIVVMFVLSLLKKNASTYILFRDVAIHGWTITTILLTATSFGSPRHQCLLRFTVSRCLSSIKRMFRYRDSNPGILRERQVC